MNKKILTQLFSALFLMVVILMTQPALVAQYNQTLSGGTTGVIMPPTVNNATVTQSPDLGSQLIGANLAQQRLLHEKNKKKIEQTIRGQVPVKSPNPIFY